jgi:hypothetical protein
MNKDQRRHNEGPSGGGSGPLYRCLLFGTLLLMLAGALTACGQAAQGAAPLAQSAPTPISVATPAVSAAGANTIFVIDPHTNASAPQTRLSSVLAIDPATGAVVGNFAARYLPSAIISPDGRYLYIVDSYETQVLRGEWVHALSALDVSTGDTLWEVTLPGERMAYFGYPHQQDIWTSSDGRLVHILYAPWRVLTVDTTTRTVVRDIGKGSCTTNWKVWKLKSDDLIDVCGNQVSRLNLASGQRASSSTLPGLEQLAAADATQRVTNISGDGLAVQTGRLHVIVKQCVDRVPRSG